MAGVGAGGLTSSTGAGTGASAGAGTTPARPAGASVARLTKVTLRYGELRALDGVSLALAPGEHLCVLGANGSGKSTLASVLAGTLAPDEGTVRLAGELVLSEGTPDYDAYRRARRALGLVFQNPDDQLVTTVVEDDVAFGPENLGLSPHEIGLRVGEELARVALTQYRRADPTRLSGGQKQRVAIAGALALRPRLLVLDEPGALLDVRGRRGIMRVMRELRETGVAIVHVTHFMEEALEADRVLVLDQGRIVADGSPEQVFSREETIHALGLELPFAARLSEALRAEGVPVPWTCQESALKGALVAGGAARGIAPRPPQPPATDAGDQDALGSTGVVAPAVVVDGVSYSYGSGQREQALDGVSFAVASGATVAVIGQTGSGKSTLARLLCGLERPDRGSIAIGGIDTASRGERRAARRLVGYVMQHPERQLFAETVYEDVSYGPRNLALPAEEVDRRTRYALKLVGLRGREQDSPFHLSGGQQRLCAIAGILSMEPQVLVLDEPTAGLDPRRRAQLEHILSDIHRTGTAIIRITHSMDAAASADQVIVLSDGRILLEGSPRAVFSRGNERTLHDAGLGLPRSLAWAHELEDQGVPPLGDPLTLEALASGLAFRLRQVSRRRGEGGR